MKDGFHFCSVVYIQFDNGADFWEEDGGVKYIMNWRRTGRKLISVGLAVLMIVLGGFPGIGLEKAYAAGGEFAGGDGSAENPYQITKLEQLNNMRNYLDKHFILMNNLDFSLDTDYEDSANKTAWTTGTGWTPIATTASPFTGVLDGGGHTISGLMINPTLPGTPYTIGLFASINSGAEIKNIALKDVSIPVKKGLSVRAGGLAGECGGSVTNCSVSGTVAGSVYVGGLVGTCTGPISNSYSTATVIGYNLKGSKYKLGFMGGGLVGILSGASAEITGSYFSGTISLFSFEGGLVGEADGSAVNNCYSTGNLTCVVTDGGGLVGVADKATVSNCYALGSIAPYPYPVGYYGGGLIGYVIGTTSIGYCYSAGSVTGTNPSGLIGYLGGTGNTLTSCYYNSETSGCSDTDKGTPKTSAEMRTAGTFTAWDFGTVWDIVNTETNCSYPYLRGNAQSPAPGYTDKVRIITQPKDAAAAVGENTGFSVVASGTGLTYQWQINTGSGFENISNGGKYSGADTAALSITDFETGMAGSVYRVIVTGTEAPAATSDNAVLTQAESADLTGLTLSGSPANFTFSENTYTYNGVTVGNAVTSITVTPTGAGTITVDGTDVATGTTSAGISLTEGAEKAITITVSETGKAVKTYTLKVTRLTGNTGVSDYIPTKTITVTETSSDLFSGSEGQIKAEANMASAFSDSVEVKVTDAEESASGFGLGAGSTVYPFDISLYIKGTNTKTEPKDGYAVTVSLPVPAELLDVKEQLSILHKSDGGIVSTISSQLKQISGVWYLAFDATEFSPYALAVNNVGTYDEAAGLPYYVNSDGNEEYIGFAARGKFIAPSGATVLFKENPRSFTDIGSHWAKDYIGFVTERELFTGTGEKRFEPDTGMTRAMFATIIGRLYERSYGEIADAASGGAFTDVNYNGWYGKHVNWAADNGIISGIGGGLFAPNREITRQEMAAILYRFADFLDVLPNDMDTVLIYSDAATISSWAQSAALYCQSADIITGHDDGMFAPEGTATRAEVATIIERFVKSVLA